METDLPTLVARLGEADTAREKKCMALLAQTSAFFAEVDERLA